MTLTLRPFTAADEPAALRAHAEFAGTGFTFLLGFTPDMAWSDWCTQVDNYDDEVRSSFLAVDVDGQLVGRASIRFTLNDFLATRGGHIGYGIIPAFRRRGYATEVLRQSVEIARRDGIDRVLVTCDDYNVGSATVIERCGGVLESVTTDADGVVFRRYWIETASPTT